MPAPVINQTTSVLDYQQHQPWSYQPFATNSPTGWSIDPIAPPGMAFDSVNGTLSGTCTVAGIYVFAIRASNADGSSDPLVLTVGIEAAARNQRSLAVEVDIDIVTRAVTAGSNHTVKFNDDLIYHVRFLNGGQRVEMPLLHLAWSLKRTPDGDVLAVSDEWQQVGFGADATYAVHVLLNNPSLLSELEDTEARLFAGTGEFEWLQSNPPPAIGPDVLRGSSQAMPVTVVADHRQAELPPAP